MLLAAANAPMHADRPTRDHAGIRMHIARRRLLYDERLCEDPPRSLRLTRTGSGAIRQDRDPAKRLRVAQAMANDGQWRAGLGKIVVRRQRTTQLRKSFLTCRGTAADRAGRRPHGLQDFRVFELALQCQAQRLAR